MADATALERPVWVCIACMRSYAATPGACAACGQAMLPADNPEVSEELSRAAEARLARRVYREYAIPTVLASLVFMAAYSLGRFGVIPIWWVFVLLAGFPLLIRAAQRRAPGIRLMADRRRRIAAELGQNIQIGGPAPEWSPLGSRSTRRDDLRDEDVPAGTLSDPMLLRGEELLRWLSVKPQ